MSRVILQHSFFYQHKHETVVSVSNHTGLFLTETNPENNTFMTSVLDTLRTIFWLWLYLCFNQVNITRTGCGVTKLCVETPDNCDPTGNSSCLFGSVTAGTPMPPNGVNMSFELSGESAGYIALGLTLNESMVQHSRLLWHFFKVISPYCPPKFFIWKSNTAFKLKH